MSNYSGGCCWKCAFCESTIPNIPHHSLPNCPFCKKSQPGYNGNAEPGPSRSPAAGVGGPGSQVRNDLQSDGDSTVREGRQSDHRVILVGHDQQQDNQQGPLVHVQQASQHVLRRAENSQWSGGDQQQEDEQRKKEIEEERIWLEQQNTLQQQQQRENVVEQSQGIPGSAQPTKDHLTSGQDSAMLPCTTYPSREEDKATQSQPHVLTGQKKTTQLDDNYNRETTSGANGKRVDVGADGTSENEYSFTTTTTNTGDPPESQSATQSENDDAPDPPFDPTAGENNMGRSQNNGKTLKSEGAANSTSDNRTDQKVLKDS